MKCPKCGAAVNGNDLCSKCSTKTQPASDTFDVTYKTFGTAELLEIGQRKKETSPERQKRAEGKITIKPRRRMPLQQKPKTAGSKMLFPAAAAVVFLVLLTGLFFWFYYFRR